MAILKTILFVPCILFSFSNLSLALDSGRSGFLADSRARLVLAQKKTQLRWARFLLRRTEKQETQTAIDYQYLIRIGGTNSPWYDTNWKDREALRGRVAELSSRVTALEYQIHELENQLRISHSLDNPDQDISVSCEDTLFGE